MPGAGTFKLFIGNIDEKTSQSDLKALFEKYGKYHQIIKIYRWYIVSTASLSI